VRAGCGDVNRAECAVGGAGGGRLRVEAGAEPQVGQSMDAAVRA